MLYNKHEGRIHATIHCDSLLGHEHIVVFRTRVYSHVAVGGRLLSIWRQCHTCHMHPQVLGRLQYREGHEVQHVVARTTYQGDSASWHLILQHIAIRPCMCRTHEYRHAHTHRPFYPSLDMYLSLSLYLGLVTRLSFYRNIHIYIYMCVCALARSRTSCWRTSRRPSEQLPPLPGCTAGSGTARASHSTRPT